MNSKRAKDLKRKVMQAILEGGKKPDATQKKEIENSEDFKNIYRNIKRQYRDKK